MIGCVHGVKQSPMSAIVPTTTIVPTKVEPTKTTILELTPTVVSVITTPAKADLPQKLLTLTSDDVGFEPSVELVDPQTGLIYIGKFQRQLKILDLFEISYTPLSTGGLLENFYLGESGLVYASIILEDEDGVAIISSGELQTIIRPPMEHITDVLYESKHDILYIAGYDKNRSNERSGRIVAYSEKEIIGDWTFEDKRVFQFVADNQGNVYTGLYQRKDTENEYGQSEMTLISITETSVLSITEPIEGGGSLYSDMIGGYILYRRLDDPIEYIDDEWINLMLIRDSEIVWQNDVNDESEEILYMGGFVQNPWTGEMYSTFPQETTQLLVMTVENDTPVFHDPIQFPQPLEGITIEFDPATKTMYVSNKGRNELYIVRDNKWIGTLETCDRPSNVAVHPFNSLIYVSCIPNNLVVFGYPSLLTPELKQEIDVINSKKNVIDT